MKILVIEDNREFRELLVHSLRSERYVVETAEDYSSACSKVFIYEYDCILLDIMLPDGNGLDLLREASRRGLRLNVIILSAKDSVEDKVAGLQLGADDYLPKPFHLSELHARIRSLLRRVNQQVDNTMQIANLSIDTASYTVSVDGQAIELGRKEYDILLLLASNPGKTFSRADIIRELWKDAPHVLDRTVDVHIARIRSKLGPSRDLITNRAGFGYSIDINE